VPLSGRENAAKYRTRMARLPRKKPFTLDINLLADWRPYADAPPEPTASHNWRYFGTATYNGVTGALAWNGAGYGLAIGSARVYEFPIWERIRLQAIMEFEHPPGKELAPRFAQEWRRGYG
jgi:hypothetical protein